MMRLVLSAALMMSMSGPVLAQTDAKKVADCAHQASVVTAIQQARLDRIKERNVKDHVTEQATWPENFNTAIPLLTPWVYEMKMRVIRNEDLGAAWSELCLQQ
ncbi:MAG: hypothetical protein ABJL67_23330 [Sulfitobacter sp.]